MSKIKAIKIVLLGAGNLATSLGLALQKAGFSVAQVYSRTQTAAETLAVRLGATAINSLESLSPDADVYLLALKDDALASVLPQVCQLNPHAVYAHTAGSVPMNVFEGLAKNYGVFYPLQTFSKQKPLDFSSIPCLIEGANEFSEDVLLQMARALSHDLRLELYHLLLLIVYVCCVQDDLLGCELVLILQIYGLLQRLLLHHEPFFEFLHHLNLKKL